MATQFNPPPNWPQPPAGWSPPQDWRPDPSWGPVPAGWQLWIDNGPIGGAAPAKADPQRIFISYRRSDCQSQANGLYDGLTHRLTDARLFMDIDSIPAGVDFEKHIREEIEVCDLVLVMIGDNWLEARAGTDLRRIDEPGDFVRLEIESALASPRVRIVPVLVEGAQMPRADELPESIRGVARINAIELSDRRWTSDLQRLTRLLEDIGKEQRAKAHSDYQAGAGKAVAEPAQGTGFVPYSPPPQPVYEAPRPQSPSRRLPAVPQQAGAVPSPLPARMPAGRTSWVGWLIAVIPVVTLGLGSFAPPLRAALQRPGDDRFRRRMILLGGGLEALAITAWIMLGTAPTDSEGSPVGAASNIGVSLLLLGMAAALTVGIIYRKPHGQLPGTAAELARRQARRQYRELVSNDPDLARSINVGRPDISRDFDDGGLIDLNSLDAAALTKFGFLPDDEAKRIVAARREVGRFHSLTHAVTFAALSESSAARLRDIAVFL